MSLQCAPFKNEGPWPMLRGMYGESTDVTAMVLLDYYGSATLTNELVNIILALQLAWQEHDRSFQKNKK